MIGNIDNDQAAHLMPLIVTVTKASPVETYVSRGGFNGHGRINLTVFFDAEEGDKRADNKRLAFRASLLPEVIKALGQADKIGGGRG